MMASTGGNPPGVQLAAGHFDLFVVGHSSSVTGGFYCSAATVPRVDSGVSLHDLQYNITRDKHSFNSSDGPGY